MPAARRSNLWPDVLTTLRATHPPETVDVWLEPLSLDSFDGQRAILNAPSDHHSTYVNDYLRSILRDGFTERVGRPVTVIVQSQPAHQPASAQRPDRSQPPPPIPSSVDNTRTFENFVVGKCNEFAHAAASNVASGSGAYNPLLIYAPTGYGKTHLLSAIGNRLTERPGGNRVLYVTSESFVNEMIRGIAHKGMEEFRSKYRQSCDVLLVDDIQFFSGKSRTQEEFFHTFNTLIGAGKIVVLTSDVEPRYIEGLEERLRTRFASGLIADIAAPDLETMCAILKTKAQERSVDLPTDVSEVIARQVASSIREAEGTIKKLCAMHTFHREPITIDFLHKHMSELFAVPERIVTVEAIIEATARYHGLTSAELTGKRKTKALVGPRHIAMFLARDLTDHSFPELGKIFRRDHATVQHGCKRIAKELKTNPDLSHKIELIKQGL